MSTTSNATAWQLLETHQKEWTNVHLKDLFAMHPNRFEQCSVQAGDILLDFS
jgi:glucose-6-phosphate isomerase